MSQKEKSLLICGVAIGIMIGMAILGGMMNWVAPEKSDRQLTAQAEGKFLVDNPVLGIAGNPISRDGLFLLIRSQDGWEVVPASKFGCHVVGKGVKFRLK